MVSTRLKTLRVFVIVMLVLLALQFEFGMVVNISNPQAIPPFAFSLPAVSDALHGVGAAAVLHAAFGGLLLLFSLLILVLSLFSRLRGVQVFGALGFLAIAFAVNGGLMFVLFGFQQDSSSHAMATMFLTSFAIYFLVLYVLKPAQRTAT